MRTTIDIPDETYRAIRMKAAERGETVRQVILEWVDLGLRGNPAAAPPSDAPRFPVIRSKKPGSLKLGEEGVYEYIPFP